MLCFITTDAAIEAKALQAALQEAVANSFNRITVDGDMSTNDTVLVLANGLAGNPRTRTSDIRTSRRFPSRPEPRLPRTRQDDRARRRRRVALRHRAGERREESFADADAAARAVANSALVKTSWHGGDPNWGRIIDALGYSPATVVEEKVDIGYSAPGSREDSLEPQARPADARPRSRHSAPPLRRRNLTCTST